MTNRVLRQVRAASVLGLPGTTPLRNKGVAAFLMVALAACGNPSEAPSSTGGARGGSGGSTGSGTGGSTGGNGGSGGATTGTGGATTGTGGATTGTGGATGGSGGSGGATGGTGGAAGSAGKADAGTTGGTGGGGVDAGKGGTAGTGGAAGTGGTGGTGGGGGTEPPLPPAPTDCPTIATGMITVSGQQVQIWTGPANTKGPMVFYWHGTGSSSTEATTGLGDGFKEIQASGGVIASFTTSTATGTNTGNNVWYTGDFAMADIILACAAKQGIIDTRQVFTAGCSAGGLQVGAMVYGRSSYLAAAMPNSGGTVGLVNTMQDAHRPAMCSTHGGASDVVFINFGDATATMNKDLRSKGSFVVNCNHGGGHCGSPLEVKNAQWKFLKAHPFGVSPEPYAGGLPADFPAVCAIVP